MTFTSQDEVPPRWVEAVFLACVTIAAASLRFPRLDAASLWLDEILNVDITRGLGAMSLWRWPGGFEPENGPLYYLLQWLGQQLPFSIETVTRLPAAAIGTLTVPLFYVVTRRLLSPLTAAASALLLTTSPLHVYYSRDGRTYPLLTLAAVLLLGGLCGRGRSARILFVIGAFIASYTAASAAPLLIVTLVLALYRRFIEGEREATFQVAISSVALLLLPLLYLRHDRPRNLAGFTTTPLQLIREIFSGFSASILPEHVELSLLVIGMITLFAVGLVAVARSQDRSLRSLAWFPALLLIGTIAALIVSNHWFSLRYVITALPAFLVLVAAGAVFMARRLTGREGARLGITMLLLVPMAIAQLPAATSETYERADWRSAAAVIAKHATEGDVVIAANDWSAVSVGFYLRELQSSVRVMSVSESIASTELLLSKHGEAWLVSGGVFDDGALRAWMCRLPLLFSDEREEIRVRFAPSLAAFFSTRATVRERERFAAGFEARDGVLQLGKSDEPFLVDGWHGPEGDGRPSFRWCGPTAAVLLSLPASPATLSFRMHAAEGVEPPFVDVVMEGAFTRVGLTREWGEYSVALPGRGEPSLQVVEFRFPDDTSPADHGGRDRRRFSARVDWIQLRGASDSSVAGIDPVSLFSADVQQAKFALPRAVTARDRFFLRLGIDSATANEELAHGKSTLAGVVWRRVHAIDCTTDDEFVDSLYRLMFMRAPDPAGKLTYVAMLFRGESRRRVVERMIASDEFVERYGK